MMLVAQADGWSAQVSVAIQDSMTQMWVKVAGFIPNLIGMSVILVVGYMTSKLFQWVGVTVLKRIRFDKASEKTGLSESMEKVGIKRTASEILGVLIFWFLMLTFVISAADALGLDNVSRTIDSFVAYLPRVIGAAIVLVIGLLIARFVRTAVRAALDRIGLDYANAASKLVYGVLVVMIGSLAIGQLQIEVTLVNRVIEIVLLATGAALAIALGLGTRDLARHVVAGVYARESFKTGAKLSFGDSHGMVEAVTAVNTRIRTEHGETIFIPNANLIESVVRERHDAS